MEGQLVHKLADVLENQWFPQRVRSATAGRNDLWVTSALAPLVTALVEGSLRLRSGGELRLADHFQQAVVGPDGWLPEVAAGKLVGLRLVNGMLDVAAVAPLSDDLAREQDLRTLLARHYRNERWWTDDDQGLRVV